jgi:hypothetical protein
MLSVADDEAQTARREIERSCREEIVVGWSRVLVARAHGPRD